MESAPSKRSKLLPPNAYTKLEPGESYAPIVGASDGRAEITKWSVTTGVLMVVLWSSACIYIALKAGSGIEASIPIAVMAIFFGKMRSIRSTILENVMVQSIGQASGVVAAGAAFVIPALYINQLQPSWWHIFLACTIGGVLGTVLIIPLRRYFVKDLHGELPFPEATAVNEILCSGESSGKGAGKILMSSIGLGGVYDFMVETMHAWNPSMSTTTLLRGVGKKLAFLRIEAKMTGISALFGLGYIIGARYAAIIASGSVLAYLIMVPLIYLFGSQVGDGGVFSYAGQTYKIAEMSAGDIFGAFVRPIGIGAIAVSGLIGMARMGKIIVGSVSLGFKGIGKKGSGAEAERTDLDMNPKSVLLIQLVATLAMGFLFYVVSASTGGFGPGKAMLYGTVGMLVGYIISFLFTPVAAQAIAIVGVNPVSGMTLITLVIAAAAMAGVGLSGEAGMFIALVIGTAVCTALSTSGALVSDFKIGYWIGSTPRNQEVWKFLGIVVASLTVAMIIPVMDHSYHFLIEGPGGTLISNTEVLPAPQANMLAVIIKGLMSKADQPYLLYALGGLIAIMLYMANIPMLAFALGMYLPISITMSQLAGGITAYIVSRSGPTKEVQDARREQGTLIASGMMAGAAIMGIVSAVMRLPEVGAPIRHLSTGVDFFYKTSSTGNQLLEHKATEWFSGFGGQGLSLVMFFGLAAACYYLASKGAKWEMEDAEK